MNENTNKNTNAAKVNYEPVFDKQAEYSAEVVPLMKKLLEVCDKYALPILLWIVYHHNEKEIGQGVCLHASPEIAHGKMTILGNIADDTISMGTLAKAALAQQVASAIMGGDKKEKGED